MEQTSPAAQVVPQAPQFLGSLTVSTQAAPHLVAPPAQLMAHWPMEQTSPAAQAVLQAPQFLGSLAVSTHAVPHIVTPGPHAGLAPPAPVLVDPGAPPPEEDDPPPQPTSMITAIIIERENCFMVPCYFITSHATLIFSLPEPRWCHGIGVLPR